MLQAIVGNAREIAQTFDTDATPVKNQVERMERDGMPVFERVGRTKVYQFNPRFAFVNEVIFIFSLVHLFGPRRS